MDSVDDYRWSGVTIVEVVSKNLESVDCCVVAASDRSSMIFGTFCKVLSHNPESGVSFVVLGSELHNMKHLDHAYPSNVEVIPKTLGLAQQHTAAEEAANRSVIISGSKI